jgi:hypothetical protein
MSTKYSDSVLHIVCHAVRNVTYGKDDFSKQHIFVVFNNTMCKYVFMTTILFYWFKDSYNWYCLKKLGTTAVKIVETSSIIECNNPHNSLRNRGVSWNGYKQFTLFALIWKYKN